jgi:biopolymer transport protein ExbD
MAKSSKRDVQEINGGPMADIAFLLLIFFLVATTIDIDSGISRKLPPMPKDEQSTSEKIKERNILTVLVNMNDDLLVKGEPLHISQLKERTKEFVVNPENKDNLPEKRTKNVDFFGEIEVSKGIISLQNDRGTSYEAYIMVQNELTAAYNELRDQLAMEKFNTKYDKLPEDKANAIRDIYPMAISEAEPKNIGGD